MYANNQNSKVIAQKIVSSSLNKRRVNVMQKKYPKNGTKFELMIDW
jgi:hypothetical protein